MRGPKKEVTPLMSNDIYQTQLWQQQVAGFSVPQFKRNMWQVHVSHTHTQTHTPTPTGCQTLIYSKHERIVGGITN